MDSKFRNIFWFGNISLPIVSAIVLIICTKDMLYGDLSIGNIFFGIASIATIIIGLIIISNITRIHISNDSIVISSIFKSKEESILFSEIKEINIRKTQGLRTEGGYISDGYRYAEIILANKKEITISPDIYENYNEIIAEIQKKMSLHYC